MLYADVRPRRRIAEWEAALADAPMRLLSRAFINDEVLRALEKNSQRSQDLISRRVRAFLHGLGRDATGVPGSELYRALQTGEFSYRMYCFAKD